MVPGAGIYEFSLLIRASPHLGVMSYGPDFELSAGL